MSNFLSKEIESIIESYFDKPNISEWKNRDFVNLSREIKKETTVLISASTLKRIFGKRKTDQNYKPQHATLNALTEFVKSIKVEPELIIENKKSETSNKNLILGLLIILSILTTLFFIFNKPKKEEPIVKEFYVHNSEGYNTTSAIFHYQIEDKHDTKFKIYFDDYSDTISLNPKQKTIGHFYKYPGVFRPKILTENAIVKSETKIMVPTHNWIGLATYNNLKVNNKVFPISKETLNKPEGFLHMTPKDLYKSGVDTTDVSVLRLYNYKKFGIDGDNFKAYFRVKSASFWPNIQCNSVVIKIVTEKGLIQQFFTKPGCSFWMESIYSDINKKGDKDDLSPFCIDLSDWKTIRVKNVNKKLAFFNNDSLIEEIHYNTSLGNILGIEVHFFGTGFFDDFKISSLNNDKKYEYDFDEK